MAASGGGRLGVTEAGRTIWGRDEEEEEEEEGAGLYLIWAEVSIEQKVQQAGSTTLSPEIFF